MKYKLLEPGGGHDLEVKGREVNRYTYTYHFSGQGLVTAPIAGRKRKISTYIIKKQLIDAVNAAIVTGRPLLLKGAPGSGKTKLAEAVASYFYHDEAYKYYFEWHVKSRSRARDGGYVFDHVGRMRDATISDYDKKAGKRAADPANYITLGALGYALQTRTAPGYKPILLIDEIDKGDIDFPNDLLLELDEMRFKVNEMDNTYIEAHKDKKSNEQIRPLVFITSNDERELPPAFLRRCLYYYIPEFEEPLLRRIAVSKMKEFYQDHKKKAPAGLDKEKDNPLDPFVRKFMDLKDTATGSKPPSTSEMLDWLKLITFEIIHKGRRLEDLVDDGDIQRITLKLNA